jgi:hypothetical protein
LFVTAMRKMRYEAPSNITNKPYEMQE